jgi:predicted MFS family arabinose efflux permease
LLWLALTGRADVRARLDVTETRARGDLGAVLAHPAVARALVGVFAIAPALALPLAWGSKYLLARFGIEQQDVGHYLWLPPLCLAAGAFGFGDLATRLGTPRVLYALAAALAACLALLPLADTPWQGVAVASLTMAGCGAVYTLVTAEALARMPAEHVSLAGGVIAGAQSIAFVIANPLIGAALERLHDYGPIALALGIWVIPGSLAWILWRAQDRR